MEFLLSSRFKKDLKRAPNKVVLAFKETIRIFESDPFDSILNNHKLHGEYADCRSVNVTGDWRLVYKKLKPDIYHLIAIGTHNQLYE